MKIMLSLAHFLTTAIPPPSGEKNDQNIETVHPQDLQNRASWLGNIL